jgi:putative phosphoesterase
MKIAILSDVHSNKYALTEAFKFLDREKIDKYIFLGDMFGYYPWAEETYQMLKKYFEKSIHIIGNHDALIISEKEPDITPEYWDVILHNRKNLSSEAIDWLKKLKEKEDFWLDNINVKIFHGTPDSPLNGRFYPDNHEEYDWFPKENEIILLGHTHYPLNKKNGENSYIINPGSIGQSRDGNNDLSFCIFDTDSKERHFQRVKYSVDLAVEELLEMNWYPRAIKSLQKNDIKDGK